MRKRAAARQSDVLSVLNTSERPMTAYQILEQLQASEPNIAPTTVYRTLSLLTEADLLHEIDLGDGQTTYDPNFLDRPSHNHLVCIDCGKVLEFEDEHLDVLNDCLTRRLGFRAVKQSLRIEASCEQLRAKKHCPNLIQARLEGKRLPNRKK